ncbi:MAG: hypothetical protein CME70_23645 [Halobacteriovorax sp.]|nr:hypothetical protein [Halobacteriovorax sp.]
MNAQALTPFAFSDEQVKVLSEKFFNEEQALDSSKLISYRKEIQKRRDDLYTLSYNQRRKARGQSKKKAAKKAKEDVAFYDLLLQQIDSLNKKSAKADLLYKLNEIISYDEALLVEGNPLFIVDLGEIFRGLTKKYSVKKTKLPLGEAKNLGVPGKEGLYFEQDELKEMKTDKVDISKLEPPKNSPFVFQVEDISKVDVKESYLGGKNPLYEGIDVWWPKTNVFNFRKLRKTQSKPKLDVLYKNPKTGKEEIFKIKLAEEIHSEGTVAALANTIGIYTDLSKNLRNIKVYLGDTTYNDFRNDWYSYFDGFDLDRLIKDKGVDENGEYILFYDGLIEQKFKDESDYKRIGPWAWGGNDHKSLRETRGLFLFSVWIGNTDLKEAENNKLIVRTNKKEPRQFKVMHDIGFCLGNLLSEKPLNLKWNPIKKVKKDEVVLNFLNIQDNSGYEHVTFADARWMVRRIAQLTREQIEAAVEIGGWPKEEPYNVHRMLVEKLISRRNGFVRAFELEGEVLPNGSKIEIMPFKKVKIKKMPEYIGEYTVDFSAEMADLTRDPLKQIPHFILNLMKLGVSAIQKIEIDPLELGLDAGVISQIILNVERDVIRNPNPAHENETFIVKDTFLIGARLGAGYLISGDVAKYREYTLIQTAKTEKQAKYMNRFFLNLVLPFQTMLKRLPKKHILTVSDYLETRGRIKVTTPGAAAIGFGTEGTISKIGLGRTIISKDSKSDLVFYDDKANFNQLAWRTFAQLGVIKVPFLHANIKKGKLSRSIYKLNAEEAASPELRDAIENAIAHQNHDEIKKLAFPQKIDSDFVEKNFKFNVLGFVGRSSYQRRDLISDHGVSETDEDDREIFKLERSNKAFLNSIFAGNEHFSEVSQIVTEKDRDGNVKDSILKLNYLHDDGRVTSKELKDVYLSFLNAVGKKKDMIVFDPASYSFNDEWGHVDIRLGLDIYKSGLEKIANMKLSDLMRLATKTTDEKYPNLVALYKKLGVGGNDRDNALNKNKRFSFRGKKYYYKKYFRDLKSFAVRLKKIREEAKTTEEISAGLLNAFYKTVKRKKGSFSPLVLHTVLEGLEKEDYFLETSIYPHEGSENKFPERVLPYNSEGKRQDYEVFDFLTNIDDALNVFTHFSKI